MTEPLTVKYGSNLLDTPLLRTRALDTFTTMENLSELCLSDHEAKVVEKYVKLAAQVAAFTDRIFIDNFTNRILSDLSLNPTLNAPLKLCLMKIVLIFCQDQLSYITWVNEGVYE